VNTAWEEEMKTDEDEDEEELEREAVDVVMESSELVACLDGSYDPISQKATFNWRIVTLEERGLTSLSAPVMTNPKYLNPY
jgi:hypothetical protein